MAWQPSVTAPAQRWVEICLRMRSGEPLTPSTDTILSPGCSTPLAGATSSALATLLTGVTVTLPWATKSAKKMRKATRTFIAGPAAMTTMRFHGLLPVVGAVGDLLGQLLGRRSCR